MKGKVIIIQIRCSSQYKQRLLAMLYLKLAGLALVNSPLALRVFGIAHSHFALAFLWL